MLLLTQGNKENLLNICDRVLTVDAEELCEAWVLGLPPDIGPGFGILHPLPQRTAGTSETLEFRVELPTFVNSVHYFLPGKRLIVTAQKYTSPRSLFHYGNCKGCRILIMDLIDNMIWSRVQCSLPQPEIMSTPIYFIKSC